MTIKHFSPEIEKIEKRPCLLLSLTVEVWNKITIYALNDDDGGCCELK